MKFHSVSIRNKSGEIVKVELWGIEEFIEDEEDINFLKKNLNFMIGLWIGRIPPDNERRRKFLNNLRKNLKKEDKYQEVFAKFMRWYKSMEKNPYYKDFLDEIPESYKSSRISLPNYINVQKDYKISKQELSNIKCIICNGFIAQGRVDFFLEENGIEPNSCIECAENVSVKDDFIPGPYPQPPKGQEICPRCKSPTWVQQRHDDQHYFLACSSFPKCRWAKDL